MLESRESDQCRLNESIAKPIQSNTVGQQQHINRILSSLLIDIQGLFPYNLHPEDTIHVR
jgi:hypothetical protein